MVPSASPGGQLGRRAHQDSGDRQQHDGDDRRFGATAAGVGIQAESLLEPVHVVATDILAIGGRGATQESLQTVIERVRKRFRVETPYVTCALCRSTWKVYRLHEPGTSDLRLVMVALWNERLRMTWGTVELGAKLQPNTLAASPFAAGSLFAILKVDGVPPRAIAAVVKHLANGRRVLRDVGVIRSHGALLHRQMVLMSQQMRTRISDDGESHRIHRCRCTAALTAADEGAICVRLRGG